MVEPFGPEGSPAQDGLTAMGHAVEGATPVVPRRDAAVGVCAGVDEAALQRIFRDRGSAKGAKPAGGPLASKGSM